MTTICEACGQRIPQPRLSGMRLGVPLPPLKCALVDIVAAAPDGITTPELVAQLYRGRRLPRSPTIKVHVFTINAVLRSNGWCIANERRRWFLRAV